jgi:methylenetetrahydrofolate dehydrogenase (NADP+)/methenyltetrahydrofolate cyclohydrolase
VLLPPVTITQAELSRSSTASTPIPASTASSCSRPCPKHIDELAVFRRIAPAKDVDGLRHHQSRQGRAGGRHRLRLVHARRHHGAARPQRRGSQGQTRRRLGRSLLVGKPVALLALQKKPGPTPPSPSATPQTANLPALTRQADVLIAAIGRAEFVTADMVKPGAVVIDVGINRVPDPREENRLPPDRRRAFPLGFAALPAKSPPCPAASAR